MKAPHTWWGYQFSACGELRGGTLVCRKPAGHHGQHFEDGTDVNYDPRRTPAPNRWRALAAAGLIDDEESSRFIAEDQAERWHVFKPTSDINYWQAAPGPRGTPLSTLTERRFLTWADAMAYVDGQVHS